MNFDQASVFVQREDRQWEYQRLSVVGGLAYRFSGVQVTSEQQYFLWLLQSICSSVFLLLFFFFFFWRGEGGGERE